jgi:hypothetical protein
MTNDRSQLVTQMADALRPLSEKMLGSGTARWGAYEKAKLINFRDHERLDPKRINANVDRIIFSPLDYEAVAVEKTRRRGMTG